MMALQSVTPTSDDGVFESHFQKDAWNEVLYQITDKDFFCNYSKPS